MIKLFVEKNTEFFFAHTEYLPGRSEIVNQKQCGRTTEITIGLFLVFQFFRFLVIESSVIYTQ